GPEATAGPPRRVLRGGVSDNTHYSHVPHTADVRSAFRFARQLATRGYEFCARRKAIGTSAEPSFAARPVPLIALRPRVGLIICTWSRPPDFARYRAAAAAAIRSFSLRQLPLASAGPPMETVT